MLNRAGYRLHIDGKSDHASWWVGPVVWCRWWIEWGPERTPVAHHISTRAAQMLISWSELFECDRLDTTGTSPKPCLWYQMMIPEYEVSAGGQSYQMQHWDRVERVLPPPHHHHHHHHHHHYAVINVLNVHKVLFTQKMCLNTLILCMATNRISNMDKICNIDLYPQVTHIFWFLECRERLN